LRKNLLSVRNPPLILSFDTWVQRQLQGYGYHGRNRFLLTSRPYGYRENPLEGVTTLEVQPFLPEQIEQFIQNWYLANELKSWGKEDPGAHLRAREGAKDLLQRLHRVPALLALAVNPLLLTMIATVHRLCSNP
jgi:predicted NACHT family NTPase